MESVAENNLMSLDEFMRQYAKSPFEIIDSRQIALIPRVAGQGIARQNLFLELDRYVESHNLGKLAFSTPCVQQDSSGYVQQARTPDVMFFTQERWEDYKERFTNWLDLPYMLIPDLAVEVIAPDENWSEMTEKIRGYLSDGVQIVWVVDPWEQAVGVHRLVLRQPFTKQQTNLTVEDTLTGGEVIPGFEIKVASLFE